MAKFQIFYLEHTANMVEIEAKTANEAEEMFWDGNYDEKDDHLKVSDVDEAIEVDEVRTNGEIVEDFDKVY